MKLRHKIIVLNIVTLLLMLVLIGAIITQMTDNYNLYNILQYLESQGDYASIYIEQYALNKTSNVYEVPELMEKNSAFLAAVLKETVKCRVQIYYGYRILGDSEYAPTNEKVLRPEVEETLKKNRAYFISGGKNRTLYYALPLVFGNRYNYSIAFIYELTQADAMKSNMIKMFVIIGILSSVVIAFGSTFISNRITSPIKTLNQITKHFSKGELDRRADVSTKDEVGELSATFNLMADNIQDMIYKLNYEKEKQKNFFDNFTHEIRTPLTTIIGYAELLWKTDDEEVRDKSLFHITSEGKRMLKMMEQLLELSKLKNYSIEVNKTPTDLGKLIEDVCDSMYYKAKRYNIEINHKLDNVTLNVDPDLLKQVVINILDNSIKYSKSDKIDITLKKTRKVRLILEDYGCGIDPQNLENVFEPYYKADKSRNSKVEGWGLGLSIVKEIIEKHEGTVEVTSSPGKGTKVEITLPLQNDK